MKALFKNVSIYVDGKFIKADALLSNGSLSITDGVSSDFKGKVFDFSGKAIFPGFCDVHVHFREPGFSYKETVKSGCASAVRGGFTAVCTMPNLKPVPDSVENLKVQTDIIEKDATIAVLPYGSITVGQKGKVLSDLYGMSKNVVAFSDDGKGVQDGNLMMEAMKNAKRLDKIVVAHCEDEKLVNGGYIHDGDYAKEHGHKGICSESEWAPIVRDIELIKKTGCRYHVCHVSTKGSVDAIRKAKQAGVDITCETAPHYLVLSDKDLQEDGRFKMNPPLRGEEDKQALIEGILDGTVDMIATDHAPHSREEKSKGLQESVFGVVGLETSFPIMYTYLVKTGVITLEKLVEIMSVNPRKRFGLQLDEGFSVWDLEKEYVITPQDFMSQGKATPFEGFKVFGENLLTVYNGKIVYNNLG